MDITRTSVHCQSANEPLTVYYTSARFLGDRRETKATLAKGLLQEAGIRCLTEDSDLLIGHDKYGCPHLQGEYSPPVSLSFSYNGQEIWGAVTKRFSLGIDVETPRSFLAPYPYARAFAADDFRHATGICTRQEDAAALLWSCKEAAMKSRGTGFHCIDPRDVRILSCLPEGHCMCRVMVATPAEVHVVARKVRHLWLALAVSG